MIKFSPWWCTTGGLSVLPNLDSAAFCTKETPSDGSRRNMALSATCSLATSFVFCFILFRLKSSPGLRSRIVAPSRRRYVKSPVKTPRACPACNQRSETNNCSLEISYEAENSFEAEVILKEVKQATIHTILLKEPSPKRRCTPIDSKNGSKTSTQNF